MDARSDIYSLGCVMYRTISGSPVFEGEDVIELFYKQVHELPVPFAEACPDVKVPPELEAIIFKCLQKYPEDRFNTMEELQQALCPGAAQSKTMEISSVSGLPAVGYPGNLSATREIDPKEDLGQGNGAPAPHLQTPAQQAVTQRENLEEFHERTSITGSAQRLRSGDSQQQLPSMEQGNGIGPGKGVTPPVVPGSSPLVQTQALPSSSASFSTVTPSSGFTYGSSGSSGSSESSNSSGGGKRKTTQALRKKMNHAEMILQNKALMGVIIGAIVLLVAGVTIGAMMNGGAKPQNPGATNGGTASSTGIATKGIASTHPDEHVAKPNATPTSVDMDDMYEQGKQAFERGDYKAAEEHLTHAAAMMEKVHDKATAEKRIECLKLLVQTHCAQKHFPAANTTVAELRGDIEDTFGKGSLKLASALQQMAETYAQFEEDKKAEDLLVESLAIRDAKMSPGELKKDTATADAAFALAKLYQKDGKNRESETQAKRALAIRQEALGSADPTVTEVSNLLAEVAPAPTPKKVAVKKPRKVKKVETAKEPTVEQPKRRRAYSTYGF